MGNFRSGQTIGQSKRPLRYEKAAKFKSVKGWVCQGCGRFWGDSESGARICCYTDAPCPEDGCTNRRGRDRIRCESCAHKEQVKRWNGLEQTVWDGKSMLCELDGDLYFNDEDELIEYAMDRQTKPSDLFIIHCSPHNPPALDLSEYVQDYLPGDGDACPFTLLEAEPVEKVVNDFLARHEPFSWYPDYKRRPTDAEFAAWNAEYERAILEISHAP